MHPTFADAEAGLPGAKQACVSGPAGVERRDAASAEVSWSAGADEPAILEEIEVEDLAVDGICGVY